jgi:integrase
MRGLLPDVRVEFRRTAAQAGVRRRFAPHQLRHAHAVELAPGGVPLNVIQRQLGYANLGTTSIYLRGIDTKEIIATVHRKSERLVDPRSPSHRASPSSTSGASEVTRRRLQSWGSELVERREMT